MTSDRSIAAGDTATEDDAKKDNASKDNAFKDNASKESRIDRAETKRDGAGIGKFLNSPFGLWVLSSVVIAALLSIVSDEQRCYSTAVTAIPKLAKAASERDLRLLEIVAAVNSGKPQPAIDTDIKAIVNGSIYFYRDYKDKSLLDAEFDLAQSLLEMGQIGQKEAVDLTALRTKGLTGEIVGLAGSTPIDPKVIELFRGAVFKTKDQAISENGSLEEFPFVLKDTQGKFEKLFEQTPCQAVYLIRDRIKQFGGLQ
jgi:hypothetical protein